MEAAARRAVPRISPLWVGLPLLAFSWPLMWGVDTYWDPLFFVGTWTGATLTMYSAGASGYRGVRVHLMLAAVSVPVWWWFELVNARTENWEYLYAGRYNSLEYAMFATAAFSTVVPVLHSAWSLTTGRAMESEDFPGRVFQRWFLLEIAMGLVAVGLVFGFPSVFFPLVWAAPFLVLDGIVGYTGGRSIAVDLSKGRWRHAAAVGVAGLICGALWEGWNFWASPKWVYHLPYLEVWKVFEMPLPGYLGYIPFAWSIHQLLQLRPLHRLMARNTTDLAPNAQAIP